MASIHEARELVPSVDDDDRFSSGRKGNFRSSGDRLTAPSYFGLLFLTHGEPTSALELSLGNTPLSMNMPR